MSAEVIAGRSRFGSNDIVVAASSGWRDVLRDTTRDPMIWFLAATALLFAWLGDWLLAGAAGIAPGALASFFLWRRRVRGRGWS